MIPLMFMFLATKILLFVPQSPSSTNVTSEENAEPFLLTYPFISVLTVAVPAPSSINTTRSAVVGADSAVVAWDWRVRFVPDVAPTSVNFLIITIPQPPAPAA